MKIQRSSVFLVIFLNSISCRALDFGMSNFASQKFNESCILIANIEKSVFRDISPRWRKLSGIKFSTKSILTRHPSTAHCSARDASIDLMGDLIAPFEKESLDETIEIKRGELVLLYLGRRGDEWQVSHLSKIKGNSIQFPALNQQAAFNLDIGKAKEQINSAFRKAFRSN